MHTTQKLTRILRDLLELIESEAARNPEFAERLTAITAEVPKAPRKRARKGADAVSDPLPDVFSACQAKGEEEYRFWLRSLDLRTLKAIVRANGFDPGRASHRWTEPDKFVALIAEQTVARLRRGSAFLPPRTPDRPSDQS